MDEMNLPKEKQMNKVTQIILQLKLQLAQEQQWRKEDQEKLYNEKQQRILIEQRLTEREISLSRKCEEIEHLDHKADSMQKKFQDLESSIKDKGSKGFGFFGKMFSGKELDQIKLQMQELDEELEIKTEEIERLHMQIFDMKRDMAMKEDQYDKKLIDGTNETKLIMQQYQEVNKKSKELQQKVIEGERNLSERQNKIQEFIEVLQQQEDQLRLFKEKLGQQNTALGEMQNKLQNNQEEFKILNQDILSMQDIIHFVREQVKTLITRLELSEEKNNMIEIQDILKDLKQMYANKFTADIDKEKRSRLILYLEILMRQECQISNDILLGQLRVSMRLEAQNGQLSQVNTIMNDTIGLHPQAYEVFQKSKERILKLGKINEILEKKNKVLQDKVNVLETKKVYQGQVN